jgi:hypothetical protein
MEKLKELREYDRIAFRHTVLDGLTEIFLGLFLILFVLLLDRSAFVLLLLALVFASVPIVRLMQRRFTYPRIGYVQPRQEKPIQFLGMILFTIVVIGALLIMSVLTGRGIELIGKAYPAVAGFLCAGGLWYAASRSGLSRFTVHAFVSVALGLVLEIVTDGSFGSSRYYFGAMGGYLLASGLVAFVLFLMRHPVHVPEVNDVQR